MIKLTELFLIESEQFKVGDIVAVHRHWQLGSGKFAKSKDRKADGSSKDEARAVILGGPYAGEPPAFKHWNRNDGNQPDVATWADYLKREDALAHGNVKYPNFSGFSARSEEHVAIAYVYGPGDDADLNERGISDFVPVCDLRLISHAPKHTPMRDRDARRRAIWDQEG